MSLPTHVSESVKKLNPHLFGVGALHTTGPKRVGRCSASPKDADQKRFPSRVVISLIGFRRIPIDDDNFVGACKHLRDAIAASIGIDDGDKRITWQYGQQQTRGQEGVIVRIELC